MTTVKKLWMVIGILVILSPLGFIIPALFGAGGAWGEWSLEEIKKLTGYVPQGMEKLSRLWSSPLQNYAMPGQREGLVHGSLGYIIAALAGVALAAGIAYLLARILGRREERKND
ncbi:MAG TPA: PDGLE domain-containing protein [Nitrospirota bacterium]|nr:PDGLE domain-containing protein [Nitrospirota bacterium]